MRFPKSKLQKEKLFLKSEFKRLRDEIDVFIETKEFFDKEAIQLLKESKSNPSPDKLEEITKKLNTITKRIQFESDLLHSKKKVRDELVERSTRYYVNVAKSIGEEI